MSVAERALVKSKLHYYYGRFLKTVADGRHMKTEDVDKIGRGRVWSGEQAKPVGLVDEFGGLLDAVQYAKSQAGLGEKDKARLILLPEESKSLLDQLLGSGLPGLWQDATQSEDLRAQRAALSVLRQLLPGAEDLISALPGSLIAEPGEPQARLPFSMLFE
jgi:protease-4